MRASSRERPRPTLADVRATFSRRREKGRASASYRMKEEAPAKAYAREAPQKQAPEPKA